MITCFLNGTPTPVDDSLHGIKIEGIRFDGNKANNTSGNAMYLTSLGETSILQTLRFVNFPESAIKLEGHHVPGVIRDINIVNSERYAIDVNSSSGQLWIDNLSVDDCKLGVVRVNGSSRGILNFNFHNLKFEKRETTVSTSIFHFDNAIKCNAKLSGLSTYNYSSNVGEIVDIIKITGTSGEDPIVNFSNVANCAGGFRLINDSIRSFQESIVAGTTKGMGVYYAGVISSYQDFPKGLNSVSKNSSSSIGFDINSIPSVKVYDSSGNVVAQHYMSLGGTHTFDGNNYNFRDGIDAGNNMLTLNKTSGVNLGYSTGKVGFFGTTPITKPTISGKATSVLRDVLTILGNLGLVVNSSTSVSYLGLGSSQGSGFSNSQPTAPYLDISWGGSPLTAMFGADINADTRTDSVQKLGRLAFPHYTIAEEAVSYMIGDSNSTSNKLNIGGGSGVLNAVTEINFYTAQNTTTLAGNQQAKITNSGSFILQNGGTFVDTGDKFQLSGSMYITDKIKFQSGNNKPIGSGSLNSGSVVITNSLVTLNSIIYPSRTNASGSVGELYITKSNGSFTVNSTSNTDMSSFDYIIFN